MEIARSVRVTGRVQGVFFRAWAKDEAETIGIIGWIRNDADGSVEAHLEGDEAAVAEMIDLMREGPPGASVDNVAVEEADPEGLDRFEVRH
jgi:acylphosphatase